VTGDHLAIHTFSKPEYEAPQENVGAPTFKAFAERFITNIVRYYLGG
jgi:hypothetical protein